MPRPCKHNGEADLATVLEQLGLAFAYEREEYRIGGVGFRPDFNLEPTHKRPGLNVELTWADRNIPGPQAAAAKACLKRKKWKIHRTREQYGVRTVLVTYRDWRQIMKNPRHLSRMIERELKQNYPVVAAT